MKSRWEHLYEARPQPLRDWAADALAKQLAEELGSWPPPGIDWIDLTEQLRLKNVLERPSPPPRETIRVALELARLELSHEVEKIDFFLRSADAKALLPDPLEEASALFLARWLTESCLSILEVTPGKLKRIDLLSMLEKLEKHLLAGQPPLRIKIGLPLFSVRSAAELMDPIAVERAVFWKRFAA